MPGARVAPASVASANVNESSTPRGHLQLTASSSTAKAKVNNGHGTCTNGVLDDGLPLIKSSIAPTTSIKKQGVPPMQLQVQCYSHQPPPRNIWNTRQVFAHSNSPTTEGQFYTHCTVLSHNVHHEAHHTRASSSDDCASQSYEPIFSQMDTSQHRWPSKRRVHREKGKHLPL